MAAPLPDAVSAACGEQVNAQLAGLSVGLLERDMAALAGEHVLLWARRAPPLARPIERVRESRWAEADLLVASDGEFGLPRAALAQLAKANRDLGLHVHGLLEAWTRFSGCAAGAVGPPTPRMAMAMGSRRCTAKA